MQLTFKQFQKDNYAEYAAWFIDPELNRQLGPMDDDWLTAVLTEPEAEGITWAIFREAELVAVIEIKNAPDNQLPLGISAIAVKPALRRQGIGTAVLRELLTVCQRGGQTEFVSYIAKDNQAAQWYVEKVGFIAASRKADENGYLEFRYSQSPN